MKDVINILSIGNSFSQDAHFYVHDIAKSMGITINTGNLYIGGCTLKLHYNNIVNDASDYEYEWNGKGTGRVISIKEAFTEEKWDIVTLQQASGVSGVAESYYPFITELAGYINKSLPNATIMLHQTWAYEKGSDHSEFSNYSFNQDDMHNAVVKAYNTALARLGGIDMLPCGEAFNTARKNKIFDTVMGDGSSFSLCRDGFHASYLYGRYLLGLVWFEKVTGVEVDDSAFVPEGFDTTKLPMLKKACREALML